LQKGLCFLGGISTLRSNVHIEEQTSLSSFSGDSLTLQYLADTAQKTISAFLNENLIILLYDTVISTISTISTIGAVRRIGV